MLYIAAGGLVQSAALSAPPNIDIGGQDTQNDLEPRRQLYRRQNDFHSLESLLKPLVASGKASESDWKQLSEAQLRQAKWSEAIATAKESILANGAGETNLLQLFSTLQFSGNVEAAKDLLLDWQAAPAPCRGKSLEEALYRYEIWAATRRYSFEYDLRHPTWHVGKDITVIIPKRTSPFQQYDCTVSHSGGATLLTKGSRSWARWTVTGNSYPVLAGTMTLKPDFRRSRNDALSDSERKQCLAEAQTQELSKDVPLAKIAREVRGKSPRETVQNILIWLANNFRGGQAASPDPRDLIRSKVGTCANYSVVFLYLAHANDIPARLDNCIAIWGLRRGMKQESPMAHARVSVYLDSQWLSIEPQEMASLNCYFNDIAIFGYTPEDGEDGWGRPTSLQGLPTRITYLDYQYPPDLDPHTVGRRPSNYLIFSGAELRAGCSVTNGATDLRQHPTVGSQLLWGPTPGDRLQTEVEVPKEGFYDVGVSFANNEDNGRFHLVINGRAFGQPLNLYSPSLHHWQGYNMGAVLLSAGRNHFQWVCLEHGSRSKGNWFGWNQLILHRTSQELK